MLTLRQLQEENKKWSEHNFPNRPAWQPLLGAVEEIGELAHAHLKKEQGIRGTAEELDAQAEDAVADVIIYLADFCNARGFDLESLVERTWDKVKKRDWQKNRANGEGTSAAV